MQYYGVYVAGGEGVSVRNNDCRCEKRLQCSHSLPFIFLVYDNVGALPRQARVEPRRQQETNPNEQIGVRACAFPQGVLQAPPDARVRGSRRRQRQRCRAGAQHGGVVVTRSRVGSGSDVYVTSQPLHFQLVPLVEPLFKRRIKSIYQSTRYVMYN